jgi:hypothetical protein
MRMGNALAITELIMSASGVLIDQAATRWQDQFSEQPYAGLPEQAQQLSRYVVKKMTLF